MENPRGLEGSTPSPRFGTGQVKRAVARSGSDAELASHLNAYRDTPACAGGSGAGSDRAPGGTAVPRSTQQRGEEHRQADRRRAARRPGTGRGSPSRRRSPRRPARRPRALARLNAEWLIEAASDWAPCAMAINRVCTDGISIEPEKPEEEDVDERRPHRGRGDRERGEGQRWSARSRPGCRGSGCGRPAGHRRRCRRCRRPRRWPAPTASRTLGDAREVGHDRRDEGVDGEHAAEPDRAEQQDEPDPAVAHRAELGPDAGAVLDRAPPGRTAAPAARSTGPAPPPAGRPSASPAPARSRWSTGRRRCWRPTGPS